MEHYNVLETISLASIDHIKQPSEVHKNITRDSSALHVFTDFRHQPPFMLEQSTPVSEAAELMRREHVRRKLVIDREERLRGIVSSSDLTSIKVMKAVGATGMKQSDLTVEDVMIPKASIHAVPFEVLKHATIGDVLATMKDFGEEHLLVIEGSEIRGIISTSDLSRALREPVHVEDRSTTTDNVINAFHLGH